MGRAWIELFSAFSRRLGSLLDILLPFSAWIAVTAWFNVPTDIAALTFIAVGISALGVVLHVQFSRFIAAGEVIRDYYIVIDSMYCWNPLMSNGRPFKIKPELGQTLYAFDDFEAAKAKYESIIKDHYAFEDSLPWLSNPDAYLDGNRFDEHEARLWAIPATSKRAAFDKGFYEESQRQLGAGSGSMPYSDHLILTTDRNLRVAQYLSWRKEEKEMRRKSDNSRL